jgi:sugar phosphate isomerase/epimerase
MNPGIKDVHLTYCTNIHAGETWPEVRAALERYIPAVKRQVAPGRPFGVGLRLSAVAAEALDAPECFDDLRRILDEQGLYVFTINGFPYGPFHGTRVKEDVYRPDWLEDPRLTYTDRLARLLVRLLPPDPALEGSVSTAPGAFKARVRGEADEHRMADLMLRHLATLHRLGEETGRRIVLALEPEPCCHMETIAETVRFFERHLLSSTAVARVSTLTGLGRSQSEALVRRHMTVCFDACHMAVEFEDPVEALAMLRRAGIKIGKIQISAGLKVLFGDDAARQLTALGPFAEGVYLHQVVERRRDGLVRYTDLPEALAAPVSDDRLEWRIHFHVPLFREQLGPFVNTQDHLRTLLEIVRRDPPSQHLEVETYTWDVLPDEYRREDIVTSIAREMNWVVERLAG